MTGPHALELDESREAPREDTTISGPSGEIVQGSIAEVNYLRPGGVDQWVMIRGESLDNPPLITPFSA